MLGRKALEDADEDSDIEVSVQEVVGAIVAGLSGAEG